MDSSAVQIELVRKTAYRIITEQVPHEVETLPDVWAAHAGKVAGRLRGRPWRRHQDNLAESIAFGVGEAVTFLAPIILSVVTEMVLIHSGTGIAARVKRRLARRRLVTRPAGGTGTPPVAGAHDVPGTPSPGPVALRDVLAIDAGLRRAREYGLDQERSAQLVADVLAALRER